MRLLDIAPLKHLTANWLAEEKIQYFSDNVLGQNNHLQKEFWKSVQ